MDDRVSTQSQALMANSVTITEKSPWRQVFGVMNREIFTFFSQAIEKKTFLFDVSVARQSIQVRDCQEEPFRGSR